MQATNKLKGIIGVINTPFTAVGKIDTASLQRYVDFSLQADVCGFLALGMAAETNKLTDAEKEHIVETVVDRVAGKVPVICGVSAGDQKGRTTLVRMAKDKGCDGVMVNIPTEDEALYLRQLMEIDRQEPGFMMIQDWDFHGFGLPVPLIVSLFREIESFKSLKVEVAPAGVKYTRVLEATDGKLHVTGGWAATQMIEALDRGVHAFMPTILHPVYIRIFELHQAGRRVEARKLFHKVIPILAFSHQHLDISVHFNKKMVHRQGLFTTDRVRSPILDFDSYHEKVATELIEEALDLNREIISGSYQKE